MMHLLNEEQKEWAKKAKELADVFFERARNIDENAEFTKQNFKELGESGILWLSIPQKYGGNGDDTGDHHLITYVVTEIISAKCANTGWNLTIHYQNCGILARLGEEELCQRVFSDMIKNNKFIGSLGSEINPLQNNKTKGNGEKLKNPTTKLTFKSGLTPIENGFLANGSKGFCTAGPAADYLMYWGLAPNTDTSGEGLVVCIIDGSESGINFSSRGWSEIIGLRGTVSYVCELNDVFIPYENRIGQPGDFVQNDPHTLELSQTSHLLGIAQGALDFLLKTIGERPFLKKEDGVVGTIGEIGTEIKAARALLWHGATLFEKQDFEEAALTSYQALRFTKKITLNVLDKSFEIIGTRSLFKFNPIERLWRDARVSTLHTRTSQIDRLIGESIISGEFFPKQKYGEKTTERKSWDKLLTNV
ncbi:acyl-CoA dehydrogenase family protein [Pseudogracilibacillus sp. SO30301A]|uniref:acyl-CoA dehydrogenase family protein n=1 Tax=Pseudogracilibacillus sp. SO30301A TaxID=3098291 RepID=UPI00300E05E2